MSTHRQTSPKICTIEELHALRNEARADGRRVVHCHGCFDIVHPGHVRHLKHARQLGEILLVTLTADEFIDKGVARPLFEQSLRAENLAALECVDWVMINQSPTATELLEAIEPDVYVKGAEYEHNDDPRFTAERDAVECNGGRVVFTSGDMVFSSTALIEAMSGNGDSDPFAINTQTIALQALHKAHDLSESRIRSVLHDIHGKHVLIAGESIIDTYVDCAWPEITGEAPLMSLRPRHRVHFDGGAAVLARHAAALGAHPHLLTPIPDTINGRDMKNRLEKQGISVISIPCETQLPVKERFLVGREKLVKLDHSSPIELDHRTRVQLIATAQEVAERCDGAIIADFGLGMLGSRLTSDLFHAVRPRVEVLSGDVSGPHPSLHHMFNADWLTPSERELRSSLPTVVGSLPAVAAAMMDRTSAKHLAVTMGEEGMVVFTKRAITNSTDGQPVRLISEHIPALSRAPLDTLGCGDALLTLSTLAQTTGANTTVSAYIGSLAAAVCASKLGNHAILPDEILRLAGRIHFGCQSTTRQPVLS